MLVVVFVSMFVSMSVSLCDGFPGDEIFQEAMQRRGRLAGEKEPAQDVVADGARLSWDTWLRSSSSLRGVFKV